MKKKDSTPITAIYFPYEVNDSVFDEETKTWTQATERLAWTFWLDFGKKREILHVFDHFLVEGHPTFCLREFSDFSIDEIMARFRKLISKKNVDKIKICDANDFPNEYVFEPDFYYDLPEGMKIGGVYEKEDFLSRYHTWLKTKFNEL